MTCPVPTQIILFYNIEDFFNLSSIESMYRSNLDMDATGVSRMDYRALTNNDKQFYDLLLRRAVGECHAVLQPLTRGVTEGIGFNTQPARTVKQLNDTAEPEEDLYFKMLDAGTLTLGNVVVVKNDKVYFDGAIWVKNNATPPSYVFYTLNLSPNFDANNQFGLDNKVKEFITLYVIRDWFRRQKYDLTFIEPEYNNARTDLGMSYLLIYVIQSLHKFICHLHCCGVSQ